MRNMFIKDMEKLRYSERELLLKVEELKALNLEKMSIESKFSIDNLLGMLKQEIDKINIERNKTISEFTSKKINFNEFLETFKDQSIRYHTNVILKDKLVYIKNENEE